MKLHEFEVGKLYEKVNGNSDFLYKIDRDEGTNRDLWLWYKHKDSEKWYIEDITISLTREEFEECCQNPVAFKDWEEGRGYTMEGDTNYYYFLKDEHLMWQEVETGFLGNSSLPYNVLVNRQWYPTDKRF